MKSIFVRGFWYKFSCSPSVTFYISENKTLAGQEVRNYQGEASSRKLGVTFFEEAGGGLVQRVERANLALAPRLLTVAEILQSCGGGHLVHPVHPAQSAAEAELLLEAKCMNLDIWRLSGTCESEHRDVHVYSLGNDVLAEAALAGELMHNQRTKILLARTLQRHNALKEGESLQVAWGLSLATLQDRAKQFLPQAPPVAPPARVLRDAPPVPPVVPPVAVAALAPPAEPPVAVAGRGRKGGRGGRGRGEARGRGRGRGR